MKFPSIISPIFSHGRGRRIVQPYNPAKPTKRKEPEKVTIYVYNYDANNLIEKNLDEAKACMVYSDTPQITWINVDGVQKEDVESICTGYGVHPLIQEDIISIGQRPKMDEIDGIIYTLMYMLYYNEKTCSVEQEQISIILGKNFVLSFQDDDVKDVFDPIREKLKMQNSKLRQSAGDFLFYSMIDLVVDNYFIVMEKLGENIESVEEQIIQKHSTTIMAQINQLRKEMITLKRNMNPVRDLVSGIMRSESPMLNERVQKYFKDVYDHIVQASDLAENYREMVMGLQDLYLNNVNLKMNEVMKYLAIVTTLMAPATVIGGIFGMNFEVIPLTHQKTGFYITVSVMVIIAIIMLYYFWARGWFAKNGIEQESKSEKQKLDRQ